MPGELLEINDCGLRLWRGGELCCDSPGYAWLRGRRIEFGDAACERSRRDPGAVENRFWQRMDLSALERSAPAARHQADLAYLHVEQLRRRSGRPDDALTVATPGHYRDAQLSLLLGILQRSRWPVAGLADAATLSALGQLEDGERAVHLEMQLHQCVLTRLSASGGALWRDRARAVSATGLLALLRRWAELVASAFLRQQRYDPMHDADAEQALYLALARWTQRLPDGGELSLSGGGGVRQATLGADAWRDAVAEEARALARSIDAERAVGEPVLVSCRVAALWALRDSLTEALGGSARELRELASDAAGAWARARRAAEPGPPGARTEFLERVDNAAPSP